MAKKEQCADAGFSEPVVDFEQYCLGLRVACRDLWRRVKILREARQLAAPSGPLGSMEGEVIANLTLAIRHLEDARMRLGEAIQWGGGVSRREDPEGR